MLFRSDQEERRPNHEVREGLKSPPPSSDNVSGGDRENKTVIEYRDRLCKEISTKTRMVTARPEYSYTSPTSQPEGSSSLGSSSSSVASSHANSVSLDDSGTFCYSDDSEHIPLPNSTDSDNKSDGK